MGDRVSTARARELGNYLKDLREAGNFTAGELADQLGWSSSKVSRIETGHNEINEVDVIRYAAHCGALPEDIDTLLERCREVVAPGYWLSDRLSSLIFHESTAAFSASFDPLVVPGLLQTEDYATALIANAGLEPAVARWKVSIRMERQLLLHRRGFDFFVHEQALHLPVGGNRVMNEQLLKLALLCDQPRLAIRVVPAALGAGSMFGGEFTLLRFAGQPTLVHVDPIGLFVEDRERVSSYHDKLARLSEVALSRGESREVLVELASAFDRPEDSPDAPNHLAEKQL